MKTTTDDKRIAHRGVNKHVQQLTLSRDMKCPRTGEILFKTKDEIREAQFYLRRAWAHTILHIMRDRIGIPARGIQDFSGRTRQSWNMVVNAMYLTPEQSKDREQFGAWKPVTDGFIRNVTETLEGEDRNFRIYTESFVQCWLLGMEVDWNNNHQQRFTINRLGSPVINLSILKVPDYLDAHATDFTMFCHVELSDDTIFAIKSEEDKLPKLLDPFPLLEVNDRFIGEESVWDYVCELERIVFGDPDPVTEEPDPRAVNTFNMWLHTSEHSPKQDEWKMASIKKWTDTGEDYTEQQLREMVDLGLLDQYQAHMLIVEKEKRQSMEEFALGLEEHSDELEIQEQESQILVSNSSGPINPVTLTFEIDPKFLSVDQSGKVEFNVAIKYRHGMKIGHSIEVKGWSQSNRD